MTLDSIGPLVRRGRSFVRIPQRRSDRAVDRFVGTLETCRGIGVAWLMMWSCAAIGWGQGPITLTLADGSTESVELTAITESDLRYDTQGKEWVVGLEQIARVDCDHPARTGPKVSVLLRDESLLRCESVQWVPSSDSMQLNPRRQAALSVPLEEISAVRFPIASSATDAAWLGSLVEPRRMDRVIARRDESTIEAIDATLLGIADNGVQFELSGQTITAPFSKLEGVQFGGLIASEPSKRPTIRIEDIYGSLWAAFSVSTESSSSDEGPQLQINLGTGTHSIPWPQIRSIIFEGGILALSSAEVAGSSYRGLPNLRPTDLLSTWLGPAVSGQSIILNADSTITFRVPDGFERLVGSVRRSETVTQFGSTPVRIRWDERDVWTHTLTGRETLGFEIPVGSARRLTLAVDAGSASGAGDLIEWFGVRLLK